MKYLHKNYCNRRIHLGLVANCEKNMQFGVLYGFREPPYNGKKICENKLFYFEKDKGLEIAQNTLVSYLSYDYNGFIPKVEYVYPISSLVIHNDKRGTYRSDCVYHDDEIWRLINEGIPYFDYARSRAYCIYYPIINDNVCTIYRGLWGCGIYMNKEAVIYEMYNELSTINYKGWPTLEDVIKILVDFKKYVDSIDAHEIIDTFKIEKICYYHSRPGKDDHYWERLSQSLSNSNTDKYLSHLLPYKQERIYFDDNACRYEYKDREGTFFLEEETMLERDKAKKEYSKEKHLAYLILDYFSTVLANKERTEFLQQEIIRSFDVDRAGKIISQFRGTITPDFLTLVNEYNDSTVIGDL